MSEWSCQDRTGEVWEMPLTGLVFVVLAPPEPSSACWLHPTLVLVGDRSEVQIHPRYEAGHRFDVQEGSGPLPTFETRAWRRLA